MKPLMTICIPPAKTTANALLSRPLLRLLRLGASFVCRLLARETATPTLSDKEGRADELWSSSG